MSYLQLHMENLLHDHLQPLGLNHLEEGLLEPLDKVGALHLTGIEIPGVFG